MHAVEDEHNGEGDSSVLYIPAVPLTYRKSVQSIFLSISIAYLLVAPYIFANNVLHSSTVFLLRMFRPH